MWVLLGRCQKLGGPQSLCETGLSAGDGLTNEALLRRCDHVLNHLAADPSGLAGGNVSEIPAISVIIDPHLTGYLIFHLVKSLTSLWLRILLLLLCLAIKYSSLLTRILAACDCVSSVTVVVERILELYVT